MEKYVDFKNETLFQGCSRKAVRRMEEVFTDDLNE